MTDVCVLMTALNAKRTYGQPFYAELPADLTREGALQVVTDLNLKDQMNNTVRWYDSEASPDVNGEHLYVIAEYDGVEVETVIALDDRIMDFV